MFLCNSNGRNRFFLIDILNSNFSQPNERENSLIYIYIYEKLFLSAVCKCTCNTVEAEIFVKDLISLFLLAVFINGIKSMMNV